MRMRPMAGRPYTSNVGIAEAMLAMALIALAAPCLAQEDKTIDIGDRNQVFIDGRYLQAATNVQISVCRPIKTNEKCLVGHLGGYSSLVVPQEGFKWYSALTKDGINWRRVSGFNPPEPDDILGILLGGATVFEDPKAKFPCPKAGKMLLWCSEAACGVFFLASGCRATGYITKAPRANPGRAAELAWAASVCRK